MGGTFSQLHDGHLHLLSTATTIAESVYIGLTSTKYLETYPKKFPDKVFSYQTRLNQLVAYIAKINIKSNFYIFPIDHPWLNYSTELPGLDAIIVSEETSKTVNRINSIRKSKNLSELQIVVISGVISKQGDYLSSTALRAKQSNKGNV